MSLYPNWEHWNNHEASEQVSKYIKKSLQNYNIIENYDIVTGMHDSKFIELLSDDITEYSILHSILGFLDDVNKITNYMSLNQQLEKHTNSIDNNKTIYNKILTYSRSKHINTNDAMLLIRILDKYSINLDDPSCGKLIKHLKGTETYIENNFISDKNNVILLNEDEVQGIDQEILKTFDKDINEKRYIIHLDDNKYKIFMSTIKKSQTRKKIELFYSMKCYDLINEISSLIVTRDKIAKLNDYKTYSDMQNKYSLLSDFESVMKFIIDCTDFSYEIFNKNIQILKKLKMQDTNEEFGTWDVDYYMNVYKSKLDINKLSGCFKIEHVIMSIFGIFENLFKIKFKKAEKTLWAENVLMYEILSNNKIIGNLYLDIYDRPNKFKKITCYDIEMPCLHFAHNKEIFGSCVISAAFNNNTFDYDDVDVLFREFGYVFHNIFGYNKYYLFSGTNVPKDYLDISSLLLEYICWDSKIIQLMANKHSSITPETINKLKHYKTFTSSIDFHKQIISSIFDQLIYTKDFIQGCKSTSTRNNQGQDNITSHFIHFNTYIHKKIYNNAILINEGTIMPHMLINNYDDACQLYSYLYPKIISSNLLYSILKSGANFQDLVQNVILKLYDNTNHNKVALIESLIGGKIELKKYFELNVNKLEYKYLQNTNDNQNKNKNQDKIHNKKSSNNISTGVDSSDMYETETTERLQKYSNIFAKN